MATPGNEELRALVRDGKAMPAPGQDRPGRFPIRNRDDLAKAIRAVGRVEPATEEERARVRRYIIRRARELGAVADLPESWDLTTGRLKDGADS
ncbi:hypothetical protein GCM10027160_23370 [Streptomyces calidiresistens]|uniref:Uncharacterized protein n=1 Tax=Streptomyces calidiresistens TaxID=1485586 RepID=A0A7W3T6P4_9ACTN|nr:hypothetical protein [Streptomyces calidiresistens]MBB0231962.1 hypothetical protein [Streptomyces calidiresistens]